MYKTFNAAKRFTAGQAYAATTVALLAPLTITAGPWWQLSVLEIAAITLLTTEARWNALGGLRAAQRWTWRISVMLTTVLLACIPLGVLPSLTLLVAAGIGGVLAGITGGARLLGRAFAHLAGALTAQGHHRLYWLVLLSNAAVAATFSLTFALGAAADWQTGTLGLLPWAGRALLLVVLLRAVLLHQLRQAPEYGGVRQPWRYPAGRLVPAALFLTVIMGVQHLGLPSPTTKAVFLTLSAGFAAAQVIIDHFQPSTLTPRPAPAPTPSAPPPVTPPRRLSVTLSVALAAAIVFDQVIRQSPARPRR